MGTVESVVSNRVWLEVFAVVLAAQSKANSNSSSSSYSSKVTMVFTRALLLLSGAAAVASDSECKMCYDAGYEQGQADCEPDTTGAVTSDPHVSGLQNQSFDFTGEVGKYYALISDVKMAVNAKFGVAYTTGLTIDEETLQTLPMREQGTWLTEAAILLGSTKVTVSIAKSSLEELCPVEDRLSTCFFGGSVAIDGEDVIRVGSIMAADGITVQLSNKKSYGRVLVSAKNWRFEGSIDYVPAPKAWKLDEQTALDLAHLNFKINKIALSSDAHGVIGQTSRVKYDDNGMPIMYAQDANGKGVIDGTAEDYEVDSLTSTEFKYSSFLPEDCDATDGFIENKLNQEVNKFNV